MGINVKSFEFIFGLQFHPFIVEWKHSFCIVLDFYSYYSNCFTHMAFCSKGLLSNAHIFPSFCFLSCEI